MKKAKFVCQLLALKIGNQPQKLIKVCVCNQYYYSYLNPISFKMFFVQLFILVIQALVALVNDPEPEHPLRADLAEEFLKDRKKFLKNAEEFTRKNSEKRPQD